MESGLVIMPNISFSVYMDAIFEPIAAAAGLPELVGKLKTAPLAPERESTEFPLLRALVSYGGDYVPLPGDSFLFRFKASDLTFACLQIDGVSERSREDLLTKARLAGLVEAELTEAMFLFLAYNLKNVYKIKAEFTRREDPENLINIIDEAYLGHSIYDVMKWFRDVVVFELRSDSIYSDRNNFCLAAFCACIVPELRSEKLEGALAAKILSLVEEESINPEALYFALTSTHWRHIALELYKCIEALFYLPWIRSLREKIESTIDCLLFAQYCKQELRWQEREKRID